VGKVINLKAKRAMIFGIQGSGKSVLLKYLLRCVPNHYVYDTLLEHSGYNRYKPTHSQKGNLQLAQQELNLFVNKVILKEKPDLFAIDEINRYVKPNPSPLPDSIMKLNDWNRHYGIGFIGIARRPTQVHSDLVELSHYLFFFRVGWRLDCEYLNQIREGLGDKVAQLPQYHFYFLANETGELKLMRPVIL